MKNQLLARQADAADVREVSTQEFDLGSLLGYRLLRLSNSLGTLADEDAQKVAGLTLPEYRVVVTLHSKGPCGVISLQRAMLIDKAWISRTLANLAAKKMVISECDPADARRTLFSLAPKGRRAAAALIQRALERQERILQGFASDEVQQLFGYLNRIQGNVDPGVHQEHRKNG